MSQEEDLSRIRADQHEAIREMNQDPDKLMHSRFETLDLSKYDEEKMTYQDAEVMQTTNSFSFL